MHYVFAEACQTADFQPMIQLEADSDSAHSNALLLIPTIALWHNPMPELAADVVCAAQEAAISAQPKCNPQSVPAGAAIGSGLSDSLLSVEIMFVQVSRTTASYP